MTAGRALVVGARVPPIRHVAAVRAEREAIYAISRRGELGTDAARKLIRELDLLEARYAG